MKFDIIRTMPCLIETAVNCTSTTPSVDERCSDPAFAEANPEICGNALRLILKPNKNLICKNSAVQFRAYVVSNGGEQLVTEGVTFTSNNVGVLIVGVTSGNATGIAGGIAGVTVTWQGLSATAQMTVLDSENCCAETSVGMVIVIDNSKSMKSIFPGFGTKIDFAKFFGQQFADDLNTTKDKIAVVSFSEAGVVTLGFSNDVNAIKSTVIAIPSLNNFTNIHDGLETAINLLNLSTYGQKAIILVSDGENKTGDDPIPLASQFISTGAVIEVVGVRSHGNGFALLNKIASGGMFVNAYDDATATSAVSYGRGMKGYYCAGNCTPPGNLVVNMPQLTFDTFTNWDVLGPVDLIGGTPPYSQFDFLPGNGLYVDTNGSGTPWLGHMRSKTAFAFLPGDQYEVVIKLAGNQRTNTGTFTTRFRIGTLLDEAITMDWKDDFTTFTFLFTPGGLGEFANIEMISEAPVGPYGNLWDYIRVRNVDAEELVIEENFDSENPQFIAPACGSVEIPPGFEGAGGYAYGYSCYGFGCLTDPVVEQKPDPSPPVDLEV